MRKQMAIVVCCLLVCQGAVPVMAKADGWYTEGDFAPTTRIKLTLVNHMDIDWQRCPVTITREQMPIRNLISNNIVVIDPAQPGQKAIARDKRLELGLSAINKETNGHHQVYQFDDIDLDGIWDELFFMTDLKANESKTIYLYVSFDSIATTGSWAHETHTEIGMYDRQYVPWWESEQVCWKLWFFDTVDMYGKRLPKLIANYENTANISGHSYPRDYGNDILWVSDTFGAGAICLLENPAKPEDVSRPRFSPAKDKGPLYDCRFTYHVLANGPLRSIIRTDIMNWQTGKGNYELQQTYTAYADKSYSTCKVQYNKFFHEDGDIEFGVGMRRMENEYKAYQQAGVVISNGRKLDVLDINKYRKQSDKFIIEWEGLALVVKDKYKPRYHALNAYGGNHLLRIQTTDDLCYEYVIVGGWSKGFVNSSEQEFRDYVLKIARQHNNPIEIKGFTVERK